MCYARRPALYFLETFVALWCIGFLCVKFIVFFGDHKNNTAVIIINVSLFTFEGKGELLKSQRQHCPSMICVV